MFFWILLLSGDVILIALEKRNSHLNSPPLFVRKMSGHSIPNSIMCGSDLFVGTLCAQPFKLLQMFFVMV